MEQGDLGIKKERTQRVVLPATTGRRGNPRTARGLTIGRIHPGGRRLAIF